VYNPEAKHLLKQAGTTLREKNSFSELLTTGFKDSLRYLYPDAKGQFTYWSMRTKARPFNKGMRLDYFVCSDELFDLEKAINVEEEGKGDLVKEGDASSSGSSSSSSRKRAITDDKKKPRVTDSYILPIENDCSDHCPIVLTLEMFP
jgi:exonuclease III